MKLKALLVAGAVCLASAVNSSAAEVFSANTVGFVNKTIPNGFSLIANPVVAADNTIASLFSSATRGWKVFKFDSQGGTFSTFSRGFSSWDSGAQSTTLVPGEGAFVYNPGDPVTITFTGEVAQGPESNISIGSGFSIVSSVVAQGGKLQTELGFPTARGDKVFKFVSGAYETYSVGFSGVFSASGEPSVDVAEAFFVYKSASTSWDRNFDPNAGS